MEARKNRLLLGRVLSYGKKNNEIWTEWYFWIVFHEKTKILPISFSKFHENQTFSTTYGNSNLNCGKVLKVPLHSSNGKIIALNETYFLRELSKYSIGRYILKDTMFQYECNVVIAYGKAQFYLNLNENDSAIGDLFWAKRMGSISSANAKAIKLSDPLRQHRCAGEN